MVGAGENSHATIQLTPKQSGGEEPGPIVSVMVRGLSRTWLWDRRTAPTGRCLHTERASSIHISPDRREPLQPAYVILLEQKLSTVSKLHCSKANPINN